MYATGPGPYQGYSKLDRHHRAGPLVCVPYHLAQVASWLAHHTASCLWFGQSWQKEPFNEPALNSGVSAPVCMHGLLDLEEETVYRVTWHWRRSAILPAGPAALPAGGSTPSLCAARHHSPGWTAQQHTGMSRGVSSTPLAAHLFSRHSACCK